MGYSYSLIHCLAFEPQSSTSGLFIYGNLLITLNCNYFRKSLTSTFTRPSSQASCHQAPPMAFRILAWEPLCPFSYTPLVCLILTAEYGMRRHVKISMPDTRSHDHQKVYAACGLIALLYISAAVQPAFTLCPDQRSSGNAKKVSQPISANYLHARRTLVDEVWRFVPQSLGPAPRFAIGHHSQRGMLVTMQRPFPSRCTHVCAVMK